MKKAAGTLEVWQRGPVTGIPALLQPIAHALLQAKDEIHDLMDGFPDRLLWEKPAGVASPAFHLQHMSGVIDRLFTYARADQLSQQQLDYLAAEGKGNATISTSVLLENFNKQIDLSIQQLNATNENTVTDFRGVGRKLLPSTVLGLLFHAAEHTMRHTGQLLVTVKVLKAGSNSL